MYRCFDWRQEQEAQVLLLVCVRRTLASLRCAIAPSYAQKMIEVMRELQRRRQGTNVFAGKAGFVTPRDLFRCAKGAAVIVIG